MHKILKPIQLSNCEVLGKKKGKCPSEIKKIVIVSESLISVTVFQFSINGDLCINYE